MSWLEKGISSLKGQITNLAKEVLAEEDTDSSAGAAAPEPGEQAAAAAAPADHEPAAAAAADRHHEEGYFGKALSGLPLFGRSSPETPSPDEQMRQHCSQLESTVQRLLQQLEEVSETRDKEALELATLRRELRLRADSGPGSASGSASGSGPGSGHSDSPQLPDDSGQQGADGTGVSPALSDDGFTKLDPSETELWEATQELSQSLETQIELHKSELEKYHQMKQDWTLEKSNLENSVLKLQKELNALQDWQSPDPDFANESEVELKNTVSTLQKENEILQKQELEMSQRIKSLEANLSESEKERAQLASNVDELDAQNQEILQQFLHIKQSAQVKYDTLKSEHDKLLCHVKELEKETKNTSCTQKEKEVLAEKLCSLELELVSLKSEHELLQKRSEELEKDVSSVDTDKVSLLESENNELLSKYLQIESENHNLLAKMDSIQLDYDSLEVKYSALVSENETLKIKLGDVQCDLDSAKSELSEGLRADEHNTSEHSTTELSSIERYVIDKLRKIVSLEIPVEYCKDIAEKDEASGKELEDHLDMVAALVKMTVDLRWKKDTLERNLVEYSRQLRDLSAQLSGRDKQIAKLEEECVMLRENMESLLDGLNVAPEKGMLPSIPETSEAGEDELSDTASGLEQHGGQHRNEERDFNETIEKLEREIETLREARSTLEHETKRLRGELQELSARLRSSESMLRNQDNLEKEVERWRKECENLRSTQSELQTENSQLREEAEMARFGQDSLQAEVSEWKTIADSATLERQDATRVKELLVAEVAELKARVTASASLSTQLEQALKKKSTLEAEVAQLKNNVSALEESNKSLSEANHTIEELRTEIVDLRQELAKAKVDSIADDKMAELTSKIESLETQKSNLEHSVSELGSENAGLCEHIMTLQLKCDSLSADLACKASSEYDNTQNFLHEKQALEEQVNRMTCNYETVKKDFEELTNLKLALQSELEQLQQGFKEKCEENERYKESLQEKSVNEALINQQLEALSAAKCASEQEARRLQEELQKLHNAPSQMANDNPLIVESLERKLHSMLAEKEQILSVLNEKTRDNGVLRSENQKLLEAVSSQAGNRSAQPSSDQTGQLVQQLNQLQVERDQLISTVQVKHNECLRYHAEIVRLSSLLDQRDAHQQIRPENDENKNFEVKNTSVGDLASKSPEILALEAKCADLAASLQQGQTQNAFLQNEMQEQHEKEGILTRELERLRAHLMEVEETYTAEALRLEEQVQDLQGKLNIAEDRLRNVSTAHTSASILANQHVETLQGQSRLIGQQRDELQSKLGAVEDREQKNAAALRNLQAVLEQFQRDKERDLASMTEKLRLELEAAHRKHNELFEEIKVLKSQLTEAKEGLSAAARLGAQLDKKSETINSLKEQISQLQKEIKGAEERVKTASQSVEGKVDKSLVKNLVVGLLTAPANTRSPALRVVASVLDFNLSERQRVGLEQGSAHNEQSLSEAFVRFLESESRPQMQLRLLPEANPKPNADGKKDSHGSSATSESPVRRSPLLSEVVLPTLAPLPVGRSSGSILKDVLKNDV